MVSYDFNTGPATHVFSEWVLFGNYYYQASDIVGFGWSMTLENVRDAYRKEVFPWPIKGMHSAWFCPEYRAVLYFEDLHISKSLRRESRKSGYEFTIDRAFDDVVENCRQFREADSTAWITGEYAEVYRELHGVGIAQR